MPHSERRSGTLHAPAPNGAARMTVQNDVAIYRLLQLPGLSPAALRQVLEDWRQDPARQEEFWQLSAAEYETRYRFSGRTVQFLQREAGAAELIHRAVEREAQAREASIEILTVMDPWYRTLAAARLLPPLLFTRGNQD